MILKNSLLRLMAEDLKRHIWLIFLSCYLYIMYIMDFKMAADSCLGPANGMILKVSIIMAILCAVQSFSYLFSEQKSDFYFGMPIKRKTLLGVNYICGALISLVPCILSRAICYIIQENHTAEAIYCVAMGIMVNIVGFLFIYTIVILVMLVTGNLLAAFAGIILTLFYGILTVVFVVQKYSAVFFDTFYKTNIMDELKLYLSPVYLYESLAGTGAQLDIGKWTLSTQIPYLIAMLIFTVVSFILIVILFNRRPAEAAGKAIAFPKMQALIKFITAIPLALISGYFAMQCSISGKSVVLLLLGIIVGAFTINGLAEVIFQADIRGMLAKKRHLLGLILVCFIIAGSFYADIWRYDLYHPKERQIESVAISLQGVDDRLHKEEVGKDDLNAENRFANMKLTGDTKSRVLKWTDNVRKLQKGQ